MNRCMREFEKTDWYGFAGAECFPDGTQPLIGEAGNWLVIVDANGLFLVNEDNHWWNRPSLGSKNADLGLAEEMLERGGVTREWLRERGFEEGQ